MALPTLLVLTGLFQGSERRILAPYRIGRHPDNDLHLTEDQVSRFHAVIESGEGHYLIRDLDSRNGTWVNGQRVEQHVLNAGDEIRVGQVGLQFRHEPATAGAVREEDASCRIPRETAAQVKFRSPAQPSLTGMFVSSDTDPTGRLLHEQFSRLQTLYSANILLSSEVEMEGVFRQVLEQLLQLLPADRGVILLLEPVTKELRVTFSRNRFGQRLPLEMFVSQTIINQVLDEGFGLLIDDARADERFGLSDSIQDLGIRSALCVPLIHRGQTLGMIYLDATGTASAFREEDLRMLTAVAATAAVQISNIRFTDDLSSAYLGTMEVLANAIEARDHYTVGHTWRVTRLSLAMVDALGWSPEKRQKAKMGGILHDIGKIAVEDAILRKTGPLSPEEFQKMQLHPEHGARILKDIEFLKPIIPYVLFHQERWDGRGYPFQLRGEDVPLEGRLLAVCDAFDAMTSHRPYRESRQPDQAVEEIRRNRGRQFDPEMVDLFLQVWEAGGIASILQDYARGGKSVPCPFCSTHIPLGDGPREGVIVECPVCSKSGVISREKGEWQCVLV